MEQKFKVGDSVKVSRGDGIFYYGTIERVFETYCQVVSDFNRSTLFPSNSRIELRYPSDHDLLDYAARDSKIAELTAKVSELEAELEKWKPKPESVTLKVYFYKADTSWVIHTRQLLDPNDKLYAIKEITIFKGEGM